MSVKGTGLLVPGHDPDLVRRFPDWEEHVECYAAGCDERSAFVMVTPYGKGAFCEAHGQEILAALPKSGSPFSPLGEYPADMVREALLAKALEAPAFGSAGSEP